jgi:hypothetical protein
MFDSSLRSRLNKSLYGVALILLLTQSMVTLAQSTFGTLTGTVSDPTGAVIIKATVVITNLATQSSRTIQTNGEGSYLAANLDPGRYRITIESAGFGKTSREVELLARQIVRVDVKLETAATTQSVDIVASAAITTETATIADSKSGREINELALNFRATNGTSPIVVATLAPGVQQDSAGNISTAGGQPFTTSFSIDGISAQNVRNGGPSRDLFPSVETIAEFKVSSSNNNAEFGQVTDVTTVTKSGANDYHGTGFWFHRNSALDATDPFQLVGQDGRRIKPSFHTNTFGGAISGPLSLPKKYFGPLAYDARNRTFFFFDYEGVRFPRQQLLSQIVPPDAFRAGDLSSIGLGQIPVNPVSARILDMLYPRQNQPTGAAINRPNYIVNVPDNFSVDGFDFRGDHNLNDRHKVYARYSHKNLQNIGIDNRSTATLVNYNTKFGDFTNRTQARNLAGSYNFIIRPNLINEFRAGYSTYDITIDYPLAQQGAQITQSLGIMGLPTPPALGGVPNFVFTDGSFIQTNSSGRPHTTENKIWQFNDNLTWTTGRHAIKGGADFQRIAFRDYLSFFEGDDFGQYFFTGQVLGNAFAEFLLGIPSFTTYAANGPDVKPFAYHYAFYLQDDFRVTQKLTLNFGLRYELHPPFDDETDQLANFDRFTPGGRVVMQNEAGLRQVAPSFRNDIGNTPIVLASAAGLPETLRKTDKNNFNPRVGFAYRPFGDNKTVIRGGAGVYTITVLGSVLYSLAGIATSNAPVFINSFVPGSGFRLQFPNVFPAGAAGSGGIPDFRRANQTDLTDPYSIQWNLTIERELWRNTGLRLTYIGSKTRNLVHSPDLNQVRPNTFGYTNVIPGTTRTVSDTRPFPNFNAVLTRDNGPSAKYHAFTAELSRRLRNGLSFQSSYTLAKNLSNAGGPAPTSFAFENGPTTLNIFDIAADYGDVAFTRRHRFVSSFLYELPVGRGRKFLNGLKGFGDAAIGGWQVTGIVLLQTGPYLTPTFSGTDPSGTGVLVRGVTTTQRPDRIGNGNLDDPTTDAYFDRSAFVIPADNIGRFGNAGVGILRGPGTTSFSMTLGKQFALSERLKLRYEAAFANLFNHLNLDVPDTLNISSSAFGRITRVQVVDQAGPRTVQMSLRLSF